MNHIRKITEKLSDYNIDAMLISSAPGEFYALGMNGEGYLIVTSDDALYITDSRYTEAAEKTVENATVVTVDSGRNYEKYLNDFIADKSIHTLGIEEKYISLFRHTSLVKSLPCRLVPAGDLLLTLRASKDEEEKACMIQAQKITDETFSAIIDVIRPGITEKQIAARLTYELLCRGAEGNSFSPIVASGANGSKPHAVPSEKEVRRGEFVTMDFGCVFKGYCSDMTRTVAVGEVTEDMKNVYRVVSDAQKVGIAAYRAGIPGRDVHEAAAAVIRDAGYGRFFGHGFGHSLGIEIHEDPSANSKGQSPLPVGAVLSAEPGIYIPGQFGVRIEDVVFIEPDGCKDITQSPKELLIL